MMKPRVVIAVFLLVACNACNRNSSQALAEQMKHLGVYAQTASGIMELTSFGVAQAQDSIMDGISVAFQFPGTDPQSGRPTAFFVNLPNAVITESEVFVLADPNGARWYAGEDRRNPTAIRANIENVTASIYKVTPESIPVNAAGFLCLFVKMPSGSADRLYALKLEH